MSKEKGPTSVYIVTSINSGRPLFVSTYLETARQWIYQRSEHQHDKPYRLDKLELDETNLVSSTISTDE